MLFEALGRLQTALIAEYSQSRGMFTELARIEALLADTCRDRVQYELLQNSDDAAATCVNVEASADGSVIWMNDGRPFSASDAEALCRSASSAKDRGESIGYRGIGFKSLAAVSSRIDITSAGARFAFDRAESVALLSTRSHAVAQTDIPLIRIPAKISRAQTDDKTTFLIKPLTSATRVLGPINPLALLFLRNVRTLTVTTDRTSDTFTVGHECDRSWLRWAGGTVEFAMLRTPGATVALPLNSTALTMTTLRGRFSCFLPLDESLGLPVVISGNFLTDPSRSHAVVADPSTQDCLAQAARVLMSELSDPNQPWFQRAWELLIMADDPRSTLASGTETADNAFMSSLRDCFAGARLPFMISPIPIGSDDLHKVFPAGAPTSLYKPENLAKTRALRVAFRLSTMDVAKQIRNAGDGLTSGMLEAACDHVEELLKTVGRRPSDDEMRLLEGREAKSPIEVPVREIVARTQVTGATEDSFPEVVRKWRTAELAAMRWLNSRGWHLSDVSKQNLGYDLLGVDPDGRRVMIEVKRVERPDARFSMTNNEMGAMQAEFERYLLGLVIGGERYSRLMLLDPKDTSVPRERVCRAWEWQFMDWSHYGRYVN